MRNLFRRRQSKPSSETAKPGPAPDPVALAPERPLYVIGDVHGQDKLLERLLEKIDAHLTAQTAENPFLLFVGDLIDRGENNAQVLAMVQDLCASQPENVTCLMGNHERMMLQFLDDPIARGPRWLKYGGLQTIASFGVRGGALGMGEEALLKLAADLRAAMPEGQEKWLRALPLKYQSGNILCVHAAADPALPPEAQEDRVLMWGKSGFMESHRSDGICVIHGHTVVDDPQHEPTRIAVDTGAYYTGRLTAAAIQPDGRLEFIEA